MKIWQIITAGYTQSIFSKVAFDAYLIKVPTRPGKHGKMRVHLEKSWNFKNLIDITET